MKIIILGAGRVGYSVAESLVSETNEITVVDIDSGVLAELRTKYGVHTVAGNASLPSVLTEAGAHQADLLIAVTQNDDINLVACKVAANIFKIPTRIVRLRAGDFQQNDHLLAPECFAVSHVIAPEQAVTDYVCKLVEFPEALQVLNFANGQVKLIGVRALEDGPLVGHALHEIGRYIAGVETRFAAIFRGDKPIFPQGDTVIQAGDEVFCLAATKHIRRVMLALRHGDKPVKRIMIAGGGNIGLRVARELERHYQVKLIESSRRRTQYLHSQLNRSLILHSSATDENVLRDENIDDMDLFLALTNDDETNIMAALLAKRLGAQRVVALINRHVYADLVQGGQIDIAISPAQISIGLVLAHVRQGDIAMAHSLRRGAAEALEIVAHGNARNSQVIDQTIENLPLPEGVTIGAIVRKRGHGKTSEGEGDEVIMPHHDTVIRNNDHVIVFLTDKTLIPMVERLFQGEM